MKSTTVFILFIALIFGCSSDDDSGNPDPNPGGLMPQATYEITFKANFLSELYPIAYPDDAMFTRMMVVMHNENTSMFSVNTMASEGFRDYVKDGDTGGISSELSSTEMNPTIVRVGNDISPTGEDKVTINITPNTTFLSFASRISPSPDWFVGIDSFNLVNPDNSLVDVIEIVLFAHDGGVDGGTTYTSDDVPENAFISEITTDPFVFDGEGGFTIKPRLGSLRIERIE